MSPLESMGYIQSFGIFSHILPLSAIRPQSFRLRGESSFHDVEVTDWYCGYIKTTAAYSIIRGYDNGNFGPNDTITREQAITMIARAMTVTKLNSNLTESEVNQLLRAFEDGGSASIYAKNSIAACLKAGITSGTTDSRISPKADITRAEVAVMVQRLLQKSGLI